MKITARGCCILATLIQLMATSSYVNASTDFCFRALARKTCPTPPTFDSIKIDSYLGKWYGIGNSALFKFRNEVGAICSQANYSISSKTASGAGFNISLINSDQRVLGPSSSLGVSLISGTSHEVCSTARKTCSLVTSGSQLQNAADQLSEVVTAIKSTHSKQASILNHTVHRILLTENAVESGLDFLSNIISSIQTINSDLSQANGSTANSISNLRELVRQAVAELSSLEGALTNLTIATPQELQRMINVLLNDEDTTSVSKILQASFWIDEGRVAVLSNLELVRLSLDGLVNNVPILFSLDQFVPNASFAHPSYSPGYAIQNASSAGKLEVVIDGFPGPYWILDVLGSEEDGYAASLVYGCDVDDQGEITENLFILSRTPNLSQSVIDQLLQVAANNGIILDCEDAFLPIVQLGGTCGNPPPNA